MSSGLLDEKVFSFRYVVLLTKNFYPKNLLLKVRVWHASC